MSGLSRHNQGYLTLDPLKLVAQAAPAAAVLGHNQGYLTLDPLKPDDRLRDLLGHGP